MQLEVGKKYRTRDGQVFTIEQIEEGYAYPCLGIMQDPEDGEIMTITSFTMDGRYQYDCESSRDLTELVTE